MASAAAPRSTRWLSKLQQLFLDGKQTDITIRVATAGGTDEPTEIKAHSLVLRARSPYFDKCLDGEWTEAAERRVELTVTDKGEVEIVQLLIKLSYSESYVLDDAGQLLPIDVRLRLAERADALEFVDVLDQVVESLPLGLDYDGVIRCLKLPPQIESHAGIAAARRKMVGTLATGIEQREGKADEEKALKARVEALAKFLGPVAGLFVDVQSLSNLTPQLCVDVKQLPLSVFKRLLASEALQLQLENEAYPLLRAWLYQSPHVSSDDQRATLFAQLAPLLRYQHMTSDFVINVVSQCPLMNKSTLLLPVLRSAFVQRDSSLSALEEKNVSCGGRNRGVHPAEVCWNIKAEFSLDELKDLSLESSLERWCGEMAGYAVGLRFGRRKTVDGDKDTAGAFLCFSLPQLNSELEGGAASGVIIQWDMVLSPDVKKTATNVFGWSACGWGQRDVFNKPWDEAVCEGSPHFPNGKLEIKVTLKLVTKKADEK